MNSNFKQNYTENSFFYNFGAKLILYIYRTLKVLDYSFRNHCSYHKESTYMYEFFFSTYTFRYFVLFLSFFWGGGVGGGGYYLLGQLQLTIIAHIMWAVGPLSVLFSLGTTHWFFFFQMHQYTENFKWIWLFLYRNHVERTRELLYVWNTHIRTRLINSDERFNMYRCSCCVKNKNRRWFSRKMATDAKSTANPVVIIF